MNDINFWVVFSFFGSISSIISLLIASPGWKSKLVHVVYSLAMIGLVTGFISYQLEVKDALSELARIKTIEKQSEFLVSDVDLSTSGNMSGYSLAVLAFLEKYRDVYPDTYDRAKKLCDSAGCDDVGSSKGNNSMEHFSRMQEVSSNLKMLMKGLTPLGVK